MSKQENGFQKLNPKEKTRIQELAKTNKDVARILEVYELFFADANKEWNLTITFIQRAISKAVMDKSLDLDDKYFKTLWEILKGGATASKTIASAKIDAGLKEDKQEVIENDITAITPETAHVRTN